MAEPIDVPEVGLVEANPKIAVLRPDDRGVQRAEAIGAVGGDIVRGVQEGRAKNLAQSEPVQAIETINAVTDAGGRFLDDGDIDPSSITEENEEVLLEARRVRNRSDGIFNKLARRFKQQGIEEASALAKVQIEKELRGLMSQTPGFEDQIHQSAKQVLGFEPLGFTVGSILGRQDPRGSGTLTPLQKRWQDAELMAVQMGVSQERAFGILGEMDIAKQNFEHLQNQVNANAIHADVGSQEHINNWDPSKAFWGTYAIKVSNGEYDSPADSKLAIAHLDRMVQLKLEEVGKLYNGTRNIPEHVRSALEDKVAGLKNFISETSNLKMLTENNELMAQMAQGQAWLIDPTVMSISKGFNDTAANHYLDMLFGAQNDPQFRLLLENNPFARSIFGNNAVQRYNNMADAASQLFKTGSWTPTGDPAKDRKATEIAVNYAITTANGNPEKLSELQVALAKGNPKLAVNVAVNSPNMYSGLNDEGKKAVKESWGSSITSTVDNLATQIANQGYRVEFKDGKFRMYEPERRLTQGSGRRIRREVDVDTTTADINWLNVTGLNAAGNRAMASSFTGVSSMDKEMFGNMVVGQANIQALELQANRVANRLKFAEDDAKTLVGEERTKRESDIERIKGTLDDIEERIELGRDTLRRQYGSRMNFIEVEK